jgi:hypothetical protein
MKQRIRFKITGGGKRMNTYQAFCENGRIVPIGNPTLPEGRLITVTIIDEETEEHRIARQLKALDEFKEGLNASEPLGIEFDDAISHRVNIR